MLSLSKHQGAGLRRGPSPDRAVVEQHQPAPGAAPQEPAPEQPEDDEPDQQEFEHNGDDQPEQAPPEGADGVAVVALIDGAPRRAALQVGDDDAEEGGDAGEERQQIEAVDEMQPEPRARPGAA